MQRSASFLSVLTLSLGLALGCGGGGGGKGDSNEAAEASEKPVSEEGKRWGGWRWKGKSQDCFFLHENRCFDSLEKACRAAGCKKDACTHDDAAPANVACEE